jgi:hypothetical protein
MKIKALAVLAASLLMAGQAQAVPQLVSGWDFSQSCLAGSWCDSGFGALSQIDANYSDLDPNGLGIESADFGTLFLDGTNGSSNAGGFGSTFAPQTPNLTLNTSVHANFPLVLGEAGNAAIMTGETGEAYQQHSAVASDTVSAVFKADLTSSGLKGTGWELSFAAQSFGTSNVQIEFSADGITYNPVVTEGLTAAEEQVVVALGGSDLTMAFVRLSFSGSEDDSRIDNLALKAELVPEPATLLLLAAGMGGLAVFSRRRNG